jgi:hypothetical protein
MALEALRSAMNAGRQAGITDRELLQMLRDELKAQPIDFHEPIRGSAP